MRSRFSLAWSRRVDFLPPPSVRPLATRPSRYGLGDRTCADARGAGSARAPRQRAVCERFLDRSARPLCFCAHRAMVSKTVARWSGYSELGARGLRATNMRRSPASSTLSGVGGHAASAGGESLSATGALQSGLDRHEGRRYGGSRGGAAQLRESELGSIEEKRSPVSKTVAQSASG